MAIVETLEIRFMAKLGNLGAQIAAVTSALRNIGGTSVVAMGALTGGLHVAQRALASVNDASLTADKSQKRLASSLKKTGRALKSVGSAAKQASDGIGLHKLDEVNLVKQPETEKGRGSGGSSGSGGSGKGRSDGLDLLKDAAAEIPDIFTRMYKSIRRNMGGLDTWIDRATGGLAGTLIRSLGDAGKKAALSLTDRLLGGLNTSRPELAAKGNELLKAMGTAMKNSASSSAEPSQAASAMTSRLISGILGGRAGVQSAASSVTMAAKFGGADVSNDAKSAGMNLSKGFAGGILSYLDKIKEAAAKVANAALNKLKSVLKIASPSREAFAMGGFFAEGFAGGILSSAYLAENSAAVLSANALSGMDISGMDLSSGMGGMVRAAVNEALSEGSIVIPLHVDGVKLGEAAIRGINRVTRASGRLMLEI